MSRIGKMPILLPKNVKVNVEGSEITIEGPRGRLSYRFPPDIAMETKDCELRIICSSESQQAKAFYGLTRSNIYNMVKGVVNGYSKELELVGVGFRAQSQGKVVNFNLGFSHSINFNVPEGITIETPKPTQIIVRGIDKVKVGEVAARIRSLYPPESYKGKGIRYLGEVIKLKAGKAQVSAGTGGK